MYSIKKKFRLIVNVVKFDCKPMKLEKLFFLATLNLIQLKIQQQQKQLQQQLKISNKFYFYFLFIRNNKTLQNMKKIK